MKISFHVQNQMQYWGSMINHRLSWGKYSIHEWKYQIESASSHWPDHWRRQHLTEFKWRANASTLNCHTARRFRFNQTLNYCPVVDKVNFLQNSRQKYVYAVQQCARYCSNSKKSHDDIIIYLVNYLRATRDIGLVIEPDSRYGLDLYADVIFLVIWINKKLSSTPTMQSWDHDAYIIKFANSILT